MKNFILTLLSETPHEPNSSLFLTWLKSEPKFLQKTPKIHTTYPENMPPTFNHWLLEMTRIGRNFSWYKHEFKIKENKHLNLTSR